MMNKWKRLEKGLDVSNYANSAFSQKQMKIIRTGLEKKINVELLKNPKLTTKEMKTILACSELGWNVIFEGKNNKTVVIKK